MGFDPEVGSSQKRALPDSILKCMSNLMMKNATFFNSTGRPGFSGIRHYEIVGRAYPTEKEPSPKVYKMTVFAKNSVVGKARFWKLMRKQNKVKKTHGQVHLSNFLIFFDLFLFLGFADPTYL